MPGLGLLRRSPDVCWRCQSKLRSRQWLREAGIQARLQKEWMEAAGDKIRNIGIIAHIDAGKTTTTERMLYYGGYTRAIGDVDQGSTVMDYLPAERERGITINSAAITLPWRMHKINLVDTPGHADFTFEVQRSIRVLDGAVCVLDGVKGVEAQTEKVWGQADAQTKLPRIVFVNKMDRVGAGFGRCVKEIAGKLNARPVVLQLPCFENDQLHGDHFCGVYDVLEQKQLRWTSADGKNVQVRDKSELPAHVQDELGLAYTSLVETLSDLDQEIMNVYLETEDALQVPISRLKPCLQRLSRSADLVPVLLGASFRNIGVQPLLDAVLDYLPSPSQCPLPAVSMGGESANLTNPDDLCALAFKVVFDTQRGPLVYIRVYAGTLRVNSTVLNTANKAIEKTTRLLYVFADQMVETSHIAAGNIGVVVGARKIRTGDTLISPKDKRKSMHLLPIAVPPPVFTAALESYSLSEQKSLETALDSLVQEDPSLSVSVDENSGQMLLSGMGELHLEISYDRLVNHFKANAEMGPLRINYREAIKKESVYVVETLEQQVAGKTVRAQVGALVRPMVEPPQLHRRPGQGVFPVESNMIVLQIDEFGKALALLGMSPTEVENCLITGARAGLFRGILRNLPLHGVQVELNEFTVFAGESTAHAITAAARLAVTRALRSLAPDDCTLVEPYMDVAVTVDQEHLGSVTNDLAGVRDGKLYDMGSHLEHDSAQTIAPSTVYAPPDPTYSEPSGGMSGTKQTRVIRCKVPLARMVGYNKVLQSLTAGHGQFIQSLDTFEPA